MKTIELTQHAIRRRYIHDVLSYTWEGTGILYVTFIRFDGREALEVFHGVTNVSEVA